MKAAQLFVVATPIGNLDDITLRALAVLRSAAVIACEDTRRTRILLDRHGIAGRLVSYHKFNERKSASALVSRLLDGESVALVSDGGTPAVSDPGYRLVRAALDAGIEVVPVPGPAAFVAAVSASGLPSETVTFRGFLPHRSGERRRTIAALKDEAATQVFYESPHRILAALHDLAEILGDRPAAVAREMTKRFETWHRGPLSAVARQVTESPLKGEFCIVVEGARDKRLRAGRQAGDGTAVGPGKRRRAARRLSDRGQAAGGVERTATPVEAKGGGKRAASPSAAGRGLSPGGEGAEEIGDATPARRPASGGRIEAEARRPAEPLPGRRRGLGRKEAGRVAEAPPSRARTREHGGAEAKPAARAGAAASRSAVSRAYDRALFEGLDRREALRRAARECGISRKQAYSLLKLK